MSLHTTIPVKHPTLRGFLGNHKLLDVLLVVESGSALWGLKNENSDTDFTGIYLPSLEDCILGRVRDVIKGDTNPKHVNTPQDVDIKFLSLHHFVKNLAKGDADCVTVMYAPKAVIEYRDDRMEVFTKKLLEKFISERAVSSALGGAKNRFSQFEKNPEPKLLYHATRFLYISWQILKYKSVQLPVDPVWKEIFLRIKSGDMEYGLKYYNWLTQQVNSRRFTLAKANEALIDSTILAFYNR